MNNIIDRSQAFNYGDQLHYIARFCSNEDLVRFSSCCKLLRNSEVIWDALQRRILPTNSLNQKESLQNIKNKVLEYRRQKAFLKLYVIDQSNSKKLSLRFYKFLADPKVDLCSLEKNLHKIAYNDLCQVTLGKSSQTSQADIFYSEKEIQEKPDYITAKSLQKGANTLNDSENTFLWYELPSKQKILSRDHHFNSNIDSQRKEWRDNRPCLVKKEDWEKEEMLSLWEESDPKGGPFNLFDTPKDLKSWTWKAVDIKKYFPEAKILNSGASKVDHLFGSSLLLHVKGAKKSVLS